MQMLRVGIFDGSKPEVEIREVEHTIDVFNETIGSRCIDITSYGEFDAICDDEGWFNNQNVITIMRFHRYTGEVADVVVGTVILSRCNDGETVSLTDEDVEMLKLAPIGIVGRSKNGETNYCLVENV